jgi:hypothetical protein
MMLTRIKLRKSLRNGALWFLSKILVLKKAFFKPFPQSSLFCGTLITGIIVRKLLDVYENAHKSPN